MMWAFSSADASKAQRAREQFVSALKLRGAVRGDYGACEAIFGELVGNVVRHAPGPIRIVLDWNGDDAVLCVEDSGPVFHFDPSLPVDPLAETGRGLFLVTALAQHVDIEPFPNDGKVIRVVLPIHARA
jgi:anti-sigma regulatory factor (Ser/Thr protein kinase)